jgi:hypothetical protein
VPTSPSGGDGSRTRVSELGNIVKLGTHYPNAPRIREKTSWKESVAFPRKFFELGSMA